MNNSNTCATCGLTIIHGSKPHYTMFECFAALKRQVVMLLKINERLVTENEAIRMVMTDLEGEMRATRQQAGE